MKNIKDTCIFVVLTLIIGTMVILTDTYKKDLNITLKEIETLKRNISTMETNIDSLNTQNVDNKKIIVNLESSISKLNEELKNMEQRLQKEIQKNKVSTRNVSSGQLMTFEATAYSGDTITATGTVPKVGRTIAVDPKVIPYGSKVYIEGMGTFIAEDCGGAIKGNIIDIFMGSSEETRAWGRRKVQLKVL